MVLIIVLASVYSHRESFIHRMIPSIKIFMLLVISIMLFTIHSLALTGLIFVCTIGLYWLAKLSIVIIWQQLRPALWIIVLLLVAQWVTAGWLLGVLVSLRLVILLLFSALISLTTQTSVMMAALERWLAWLKWFGFKPAKVSLAISLVFRFIPMMLAILKEVREAQKTRGLERSFIAVAIPVIIRSLVMADCMAQAIDARSCE